MGSVVLRIMSSSALVFFLFLYQAAAQLQVCSGPGALCQQANGVDRCTPCPAGTACTPWIGQSGNAGASYCQFTDCIVANANCAGRVGVCCSGLTCVADGNGGRICTAPTTTAAPTTAAPTTAAPTTAAPTTVAPTPAPIDLGGLFGSLFGSWWGGHHGSNGGHHGGGHHGGHGGGHHGGGHHGGHGGGHHGGHSGGHHGGHGWGWWGRK